MICAECKQHMPVYCEYCYDKEWNGANKLRAENEALRQLVEEAYREGHFEGAEDYFHGVLGMGDPWEDSKMKKRLEGIK